MEDLEDIIIKEGVYKGVSYTIAVRVNDYGLLTLESIEGVRANTQGRILYELLTPEGFEKHANRIIGYL